MNEFRATIEIKQEWNTQKLHFDPDSSPKVWQHYKKYYSDRFWTEKYDFEKLHFFEYINSKTGPYVDLPLSFYNRMNVLKIGVNPVTRENGLNYYQATPRLSGETDFNFNGEKYGKFLKILFKDCGSNKEKFEENYKLLKYCNTMHHTLLNFSLMQSMGNIQGFKSKGLHIKNREYEWLDRLDTLVYKLNEFYKLEKEKRKENIIIVNGKKNSEYLLDYLNCFSDVYDYCNKVYFISEKSFVNELIESGKKPITCTTDVVNYMNLAIAFWDKKEESFNNLDK